MIPEEKTAAVARALREAFGVTGCEDLRLLADGFTSTRVFRIVVRGCPYLMRICTRTDGRNEPTRQFACMKIAAEAGLAPRIWYTNVEDRISIIDFIDARPLALTEAAVLVARTLQSLHAAPGFPKLANGFDTAPTFLLRASASRDGFVQRFQASKILPESETAELLRLYARVTGVYSCQDSDMVASHNDLKPPNMLFDGERLWLIDWEAAFLNDRYNDLAVMANFVVTNGAVEEIYLRTYFGEAAGEYSLARFYLMRQIVHLFYAMVFILLGSSGKPIDSNAPVPDFRDFHSRIWTGEVSLDTGETKVQFGRVHMNQLLQNAQTAQFQEALRIVSDRGGRS